MNEANKGIYKSSEKGDKEEVGYREAFNKINSTLNVILNNNPLTLYTSSLK